MYEQISIPLNLGAVFLFEMDAVGIESQSREPEKQLFCWYEKYTEIRRNCGYSSQ